jgi:hypothetical protein
VTTPSTPSHPFYFPARNGLYEVAPGLARFGRDFGNGHADRLVFQVDSTFAAYRSAKLASRRERLGKYFRTHELVEGVAAAIAAFVVRRLAEEHPSHFALSESRAGGHTTLRCALTAEVLTFDAEMRLVPPTEAAVDPPYVSALDALACQVQEDLAVVSMRDGRHWLSAAHVCFPNGWAPQEKIGGDFAALHEPVAGMQQMNRRGDEFARVMVEATRGLVRFAWGVTFDARLDHHPESPRDAFDPRRPRAFVRVERQTIWGFPKAGAALFTIRTYLYDCATLRCDPSASSRLVAAIGSMPPASVTYKGLASCRRELLAWLSGFGFR